MDTARKPTAKPAYNMPMYKSAHTLAAVALLLACSVASAEICKVRDCHDGDTCTLVCDGQKTKVRLHCIDAPEMQQAGWGRESRDALRKRLPELSTVELRRVDTDKYGRTVGVLTYEQVNINLQMVHSGWAAAYPKYCHEPVYYQAQDDAEKNRRGIWREEGPQQRPWDWRKQQRERY